MLANDVAAFFLSEAALVVTDSVIVLRQTQL